MAATTTTGVSLTGWPVAVSKKEPSTVPPMSLVFRAEQNPVHIHDFHATVLHLLGFDHTKLTYRFAGRDFRLTDVHGTIIKEMIA